MENASKALIMADGILIAIIIIALLIKGYTNVSIFQKTKLSEEEQEKLVAFNEQYTKYLGQYVYGIEVSTLMNKCEDDGNVIVELEKGSTIPPNDVGQDTKYYKCTGIEYDNSTGKVKKIKFAEVKLSK